MSRWQLLLGIGLAGLLAAGTLRAADPDEPALMSYQTNQSFTVNAYIGMINGDPFFVENILQPIDDKLQRLAHASRTIGEFRAAAHDFIEDQVGVQIRDSLVIKAAKDALSDDDNRRVEGYMNQKTKSLLTTYAGSAAKADQDLRAQGSSMEKTLADAKRQFIKTLFLRKTLLPKIVVTRQQILQDYQRNLKTYTVPGEVDLYTITIPISRYLQEAGPDGQQVKIANPTAAQIRTATEVAASRARDIIVQLKNGADFALLSENNSSDIKAKDGGRWPHTRKGMLALQPIEDAAFALAPHSVANPVVIPNPDDPARGVVVIVKIEDATPGRVIPFEEAQEAIELKLREQQFNTLSNEYYAKLRTNAAVEGVDHMADIVTDAAVTRYLVK